jgi:predicted RNase H-like nuclease
MRSHHSNQNARVQRKARHPTIRSWREHPVAQVPSMVALRMESFERALRQERVLSGRQGYDINRHIRLKRLRALSDALEAKPRPECKTPP